MKKGFILGAVALLTLGFASFGSNVVKAETSVEDLGDINCDGLVNSNDAVLIKQMLAGYTVDNVNETNADVNCDGAVDAKDAVLIMQKLAGYDVTFGKSEDQKEDPKEDPKEEPKVEPLKIVAQLNDLNANQRESFEVSILVSGGTKPYTYTWYKKDSVNTSYQVCSNERSFNYLMTTVGNKTTFYCVVRDAEGQELTSDSFVATCVTRPMVITEQPQNVTVEAGTEFTLNIRISGGKAPYKYEWYQRRVGNQSFNLVGTGSRPSASFNISGAGESLFYCKITDADGKVITSDEFKVSVVNPLEIYKQSGDFEIKDGEIVDFFVEVIGGTQPYTYTWQISKDTATWNTLSSKSDTCKVMITKVDQYVKCTVTDANNKSVTSKLMAVTIKK